MLIILDYLIDLMPRDFTFTYMPIDREYYRTNLRPVLQSYIDTAVMIKKTAHYKSSYMEDLDIYIAKIRDQLVKPSIISMGKYNASFDLSFMAFAAPSLVGKTQSVFLLDRSRPLYFVSDLSSKSRIELEKSQQIYKNFFHLGQALRQCAIIDLVTIGIGSDEADILKLNNELLRERDTNFTQISASVLQKSAEKFRFRVLGFLGHLIEESEKNYDSSRSWMEFYASLEKQYQIVDHLTIYEFKQRYMTGEKFPYVVFLDEYVGYYENVFIRNLLRACSILCIVANTNTDITNLLGKRQAKSSRQDDTGINVWCTVVTEFDPPFVEVYSTRFRDVLTRLTGKLRSSRAGVRIFSYFEKMLTEMGDRARMSIRISPGVFKKLLEVLEELDLGFTTDYKDYSESAFMSLVYSRLIQSIYRNKPSIYNTRAGQVANSALHISQAYLGTFQIVHSEASLGFIRDHLFHAVNSTLKIPYDESVPVSRPEPSLINLIKGRKNMFAVSRDAFMNLIVHDVSLSWKPSVFMKQTDHLTIMACLSGFIAHPVPVMWKIGHELRAESNATYSFDNPVQNMRDWASFEGLVSMAIVEGSHYVCESQEAVLQLRGIGANSFLSNLIFMLYRRLSSGEYKKEQYACNSNIPSYQAAKRIFDIHQYLDNLIVPFLYPANLDLPEFVKDAFPLHNCTENSVKLGEFKRTENKTRIDSVFEVLQRTPFGTFSLGKAIVECKYWDDSVGSADLIEILGNFQLHLNYECPVFISFIFSSKIVASVSSNLEQYLKENKINLYKVVPDKGVLSGPGTYRLEPHSNVVISEPRLVTLIFRLEGNGKVDEEFLARTFHLSPKNLWKRFRQSKMFKAFKR